MFYPGNTPALWLARDVFTLFPPEQFDNLYVGPVDKTPSGQAISLVDFANPDLSNSRTSSRRWRRVSGALCEPGDAIYIPSPWWAPRRVPVIVQYVSELLGDPQSRITHLAGHGIVYAMLTVRIFPRGSGPGWKAPLRSLRI
ncbi:MAG: hypothetical protein CM15mP103_03810 [Gammaproteobacteria bacterium]|nr:MAG: hypothetical protein CM15mP103_03810 [Gammaproteobacteria bacterium]